MPAKSKAQQKAAGAALAAKRGDRKATRLRGASKAMYEAMSVSELDEMASTERKNKPAYAGDRRRAKSASATPRRGAATKPTTAKKKSVRSPAKKSARRGAKTARKKTPGSRR